MGSGEMIGVHHVDHADDIAAEIGRLLADDEDGARLGLVAQRVAQGFDAGCVLFFFTRDGAEVTPVAHWHDDPQIASVTGEYAASSGVSASGLLPLVQRGEPVLVAVDDPAQLAALVSEDARSYVERTAAISVLIVPVLVRGAAIGGIGLWRFRGQEPFTTDDQERAQRLVGRVSTALDGVRRMLALRDELRDCEHVECRLAEAVEHFASAFEAAPVGMTIGEIDAEGIERIVAVNDALAQMLATDREELRRRGPSAFVHPADRALGCEDEKRVRSGRLPSATVERRYVRGDGTSVWLEQQISLAGSADRSPALLVCQFQDITGRRQADERLRRLAELVEHHGDAIVGLSVDGVVTAWNSGAADTYGYTASEILGSPVTLLVPPASHDELHAHLRRVLAGETLRGIETLRRDRSGREFDIALTLSPVFDAAGAVAGVSAVCRDITDQRRMRDALTHNEERYRRIVETAGEGLWLTDSDGTSTVVNRSLCEMLGRAEEQIVGRPFWEFVAPDRAAASTERFRSSSAALAGRFETRLIHADGHELNVLVNLRLLHGEGGTFSGVLALITDIEDRVQAEIALRESEALTRSILDTARDGIVTIEADTTIIEVNRAAESLTGWSRDDMLGTGGIELLVAPEYRERLAAMLDDGAWRAIRSRTIRESAEILRADGTSFPADIVISRVDSTRPLFTAHIRDVSAARRADSDRRQRVEEHARVAVLSRNALGPTSVDDLAGEAAAMVRDVLGLERVEVWQLGANGEAPLRRAHVGAVPGEPLADGALADLLPPAPRAVSVIADAAGADAAPTAWRVAGAGTAAVAAIRTRDNEAYGLLCALAGQTRTFADHELDYLETTANVLAAAIDKAAVEAEIAHRALHDPLTGLPNRTLFLDRARQAIAAGRGAPVGLLVIDIDRFSYVNDTLGHETGDRLLRAVAERLREVLQPGETLARLGGDEFALLLVRPGGERTAIAAAERILEAVRHGYVVDGLDINLTASVGIDVVDERGEAEALLRDADVATYRVKQRGGDGFELFDLRMRRSLLRRLETERGLRQAIDRSEFELVFQPIVSLEAGRIVAAEALLRWRDPARGLVAPSDFLHVAEETGLIRPIGEWVMLEACRELARLDAQSDVSLTYVSVNVSPRELDEARLSAVTEDVLQRTGVDPGRLALELTESVLMKSSTAPRAVLHDLRDLGVRLLLDDFGTGYSSLGYLKRFPLHGVKIDRSFVAGLRHEPGDRHIVEAMVSLSRALGLDVIAEGVENVEEARWLRRLGCAVAQGHLFARPSSLADLAGATSDRLASSQVAPAFGRVEEHATVLPPRNRWVRGEEETMTASEAAAALQVSASTVRRLADSGQIPTVRTSGGHRRFTRSDVEAFAGHSDAAPKLRAAGAPVGPIPLIADILSRAGRELAVTAGQTIYDDNAPGWFARDAAVEPLDRWALELAAACRDGDEEASVTATLRLLDASMQEGSGLAELDAFLGRFLGLLVHSARGEEIAAEVLEVRRLFGRVRQRTLHHVAL